MSHWAKPRMTVDEAARAIYELWGCTEPRHMDEHVRAILRGVESDALERAAAAVDCGCRGVCGSPSNCGKEDAAVIRALKHRSHELVE
jgi:hypothetical protein